MLRNLFLIVSVFIALSVLTLSFANVQPVQVNLLGATHELPLGVLLFSACVSGSLVPLSLILVFARRRVSHTQKLADWQREDKKLMKEIASDREKQLEAKVATLEAALKSALSKK